MVIAAQRSGKFRNNTAPIQIPEWWTIDVQTEVLNFGNSIAAQQILKANSLTTGSEHEDHPQHRTQPKRKRT